MNIFDFILLVPPTYFCYLGIRKGFVKRILAILGLIFGVVVSYAYHNQFADFISDYWASSSVKYLAYVVPFVIVIVLIKVIAAAITRGLKIMALSPINIFLGAIFGIAQGALFSILIALFGLVTNNTVNTPLQGLYKESYLIALSEEYLNALFSFLIISV
mgnify:FL=1